jgi:hypothetical protein
MAALPTFVTEANALAVEMEGRVDEMDGKIKDVEATAVLMTLNATFIDITSGTFSQTSRKDHLGRRRGRWSRWRLCAHCDGAYHIWWRGGSGGTERRWR